MWGLWWGLGFMGFMCRWRGGGGVRGIFEGGEGLGIGDRKVGNLFAMGWVALAVVDSWGLFGCICDIDGWLICFMYIDGTLLIDLSTDHDHS